MLDKLVIHLKNIIFFKAVIYIIIAILLFTLLPIFANSLEDDSYKQKKSYALLQTAKLKLESIEKFESNTLQTKEKYQKLLSIAKHQSCLNRNALINKINTLNKKYTLFEPIFIRISRLFDSSIATISTSNIKMNNYNIKIAFKAKDHITMLMLCNDLYNMLPNGSIITDTNIKSIDALTPDVISKLNTKNTPGLLDVTMNIQLREIIYEK